jgi:hypothetical protein
MVGLASRVPPSNGNNTINENIIEVQCEAEAVLTAMEGTRVRCRTVTETDTS